MLYDRFMDKVWKTPGCWEWTGARQSDGYGVISTRSGLQLAHRTMWAFAYGPIPCGLNVLHQCDNPRCVNPDHLFLGTQLDNIRDMFQKGRAPSRAGDCNPNARLSSSDVRQIRLLREYGSTARELADLYDVTPGTVFRVLRHQTWKGIA